MSDAGAFPIDGRPTGELLDELRAERAGDLDWRSGRAFSLVYNVDDPELEALQHEVASMFLHENALNPFRYVTLLRMESELLGMVRSLFGAGAAGLSSGGTESIFLAVLDEGMIVYLMKQEGRGAIRTTAVLGTRRPAHCTALGKTFLAFMPADEVRAIVERQGMPALTPNTITTLPRLWEELAEVRLRGYAVDREEVEEGLTCIAAPVRDHTGRQVAAVSVAGPTVRIAPEQERLGRRIAAAGLEISRGLGHLPRPTPAADRPAT